MDNTINRKRKGKLLLKNEEIKGERHIQTQTHRNFIYFGDQGCLSQSEENKWMLTCGNEGTMSL